MIRFIHQQFFGSREFQLNYLFIFFYFANVIGKLNLC